MILHFACRGSEAPEGFGDLKAVVFGLIEKHPDQIIQKNPYWQTQQLLPKREREREREH